MDDLDQRLLALAIKRAELDKAKEHVKLLQEAFDTENFQLAEYMFTAELGTRTVQGIQFIPVEKIYSKVEDEAVFMEWVRANDMWDVTHARNANKINALCNELKEGRQDMPPGINPNFVEHKISIRGGKS